MVFSEQEEKTFNSAETPDAGEVESTSVEAEMAADEVEAPAEGEVVPAAEEETEALSDQSRQSDSESTTQPEEAQEVETTEAELPDLETDLTSGELQENEQIETPSAMVEDDIQETIAEPNGDELAESELDEQEPGVEADDLLPEAVQESDTTPDEADSADMSFDFLDEDQMEVVEGEEDGRSWYVVHCYSGYENKVRHNLEQRIETMGMKDKIFDIVVPTEEEIEVREGKRRTVERRVFPGYILVNMVMTEESWYVVRNTPGVTGFVGMGNTPTPLRPEEVSQIIKRMEAEAPRIKVTFKSGERVRIVDGPFNDFRGTVSEIDMERAKVRVMVNFFGRETPVELDFLQVEKT